MTDRVQALTVIFDKPIRIDDAQKWIDAIRLMNRVLNVVPHISENMEMEIAQNRAESKLREQMMDVLWPDMKKTR